MTARETHWRTLLRAASWRLTGIALTLLLAWYISGDLKLGLQISIWYHALRMGMHYLHDRLWARSLWGMRPVSDPTPSSSIPPGGTQA